MDRNRQRIGPTDSQTQRTPGVRLNELGIERIAMIRYGINDIRLFYERAAEKSRVFRTGFLSPLQGFCYSALATHGSRRGLFSVAALRLLAPLVVFCSLAF